MKKVSRYFYLNIGSWTEAPACACVSFSDSDSRGQPQQACERLSAQLILHDYLGPKFPSAYVRLSASECHSSFVQLMSVVTKVLDVEILTGNHLQVE